MVFPATKMPICALVGDSYIRRLGEYALLSQQVFDLTGYDVRFLGQGGSSIFGRKNIQPRVDQALALPSISILLLNIGSNDVQHIPEDRLVTGLISLARYCLSAVDGLVVVLCQLHFRSDPPCSDFNDKVASINRLLLEGVQSGKEPRLHFARLRGLYRPPAAAYCDGVHYASTGLQLMLRGVRAALHRAARFNLSVATPWSGMVLMYHNFCFGFLASAPFFASAPGYGQNFFHLYLPSGAMFLAFGRRLRPKKNLLRTYSCLRAQFSFRLRAPASAILFSSWLRPGFASLWACFLHVCPRVFPVSLTRFRPPLGFCGWGAVRTPHQVGALYSLWPSLPPFLIVHRCISLFHDFYNSMPVGNVNKYGQLASTVSLLSFPVVHAITCTWLNSIIC